MKIITTIEAKGLAKLRDKKKAIADARTGIKLFLQQIEDDTRKQFYSQTAPDGSPWADLKPETWKRKKTQTIGRETDKMIDSLYSRLANLQGEIGMTTPYSVFFHSGTKHSPARPILAFALPEAEIAKGKLLYERHLAQICDS